MKNFLLSHHYFKNSTRWTVVLFLSLIGTTVEVHAKSPAPKGVLPELQLNKKTEAENLKTAASVETMITKSEEAAINKLQQLLKKYKGTAQEPDMLFRLAELYGRRAKTGRFVDLYRGDKTLAEILTPKLTNAGAKSYLSQAISHYQIIIKKFPQYNALDEVLFNMAFAHEQRGEPDPAMKYFSLIVEKYKSSPLLPEVHMALGELYFMKQNYSESQKNYERVQDWPNAPIAPIALYKSAWCSYNLKNTLEAISKIEKLLFQSRERPLISHIRTEARRDLALFFSEVGEIKNSISYFKKHLLVSEIGPTILELSTIYERHGKSNEMDEVLSLFLNEYPEDESSGKVHLRRVQFQNENLKFDLVINSIKSTTKLCQSERWKTTSKETLEFCQQTYPSQLKELAAEWWENWNKLKRVQDFVPNLTFMLDEYLKFEKETEWNVGIHMSYADLSFSLKKYKQSTFHYEGVSKIEKLDPKILPEALYGAIVSLDREMQENSKDQSLRQHMYMALNNYIQQCPKGEFIDDALFKKAYLFFEEKEYDQALEWIKKIKSTKTAMKEKQEDLTLEIHRSKKNYQSLADASALIMKTSSGERFTKIKTIYQSAQQAIIQDLIARNKNEDAALKSKAFYLEHRPEEKALDALHLSIELSEKIKHYREAAEHSETLAKEFKSLKKDSEADKFSHHAVELFLQLGDLPRAQKSLDLAYDYSVDPNKKREALELKAEFTSWYGDVDAIESAWKALESHLSDNEKSAFKLKQFKYFEQYAPEKAQAMKQSFIQKGLEPYYSESLFSTAQKTCDEKKWSQCYQMTLKLNKDATPAHVRAQARYLQSQVLLNDYNQQSMKSSPERLAIVMSIKAEKFDKAVQVLNTVSQKSEILSLRKQAVNDLIYLYNNYVTEIKKSLETLDSSNPDQASLRSEINQILPVLENRPKELEIGLNELNKFEESQAKEQKIATQKIFPELKGQELRIYVPTWEETTPYKPLMEVKASDKNCVMSKLSPLTSLFSLGKEANFCLSLKKYKELEFISLKMSDLYPDTPWGPFYLSLMSSQQNSPDRSLWYLKLAQKRTKEPLLAYEDTRLRYNHNPDSIYYSELKKLGGVWDTIEELTFLSSLNQLKNKQCETAPTNIKELRSSYWKSIPLNQMLTKYCPGSEKVNQRAISSSSEN